MTEEDNKTKHMSSISIRNDDSTYTTTHMARDEFAALDFPGRELFGPLNDVEHNRFASIAATCATSASKPGACDLYERVIITYTAFRDHTFYAGPEVAVNVLKCYASEIAALVAKIKK